MKTNFINMETLQPKLRFPEFKGDWQIEPIGNYIELFSGIALKGEEISDDISGKPILRGINITEGFVRHTKEIDKYYIGNTANIDKYFVKENDLVLGMDGSKVGKNVALITKVDEGAILIQRVARIRANSKSNIRYIYQHIFSKRFHDYVDVVNTSSGIPHISSQQIKDFKIGFSTIEEQTKIANFLSSVDEKINLLKEKKALLEDYKKGIMQKIFNQGIRFKDDNGNDFEDWKEKSLGQIGNTFNGLTGKTKEDFGIGKPYIQYKQIFDNSKINIQDCQLVNINEKDNQNKVQFGDVFFTVSSETQNEIGTASVLLINVKEMYLNSFCFGYRANSLKELVPEFSRYLFRNELFRNDIIKLAQGSTRYNMSKVSLMKLIVSLPQEEEQIKIANFLSAIDEKIELVSNQIQDTQEYKKGLLQQMFV